MVLTAPFIPQLFQGEEWGASSPFLYFTDHPEPDLGRAVRDGRRQEFAAFGWKPEDVPDPQARESFERSKLNWAELVTSSHQELLDWHRQLIQLRHTETTLTDGLLEAVAVRFDEAAQWLIVERGPITVACNFARERQRLDLGAAPSPVLLASHPDIAAASGQIELPPDSVVILKRAV